MGIDYFSNIITKGSVHMIFKKFTSIILLMVLSISSSLCVAADMSPNDKEALKGLKSAKAVFDITTANPKKLNFYLKLIGETAKSMKAQGVKPKFVLAFRGPATKYVSTDRSKVKLENLEVAEQITTKIHQLAKIDDMELVQCAVAAKALKVDTKTIDPAVTVIGNSWIALIAYQNKGYAIVPVR